VVGFRPDVKSDLLVETRLGLHGSSSVRLTGSARRHLRQRPPLQSAGTARRHDADRREVPELLILPTFAKRLVDEFRGVPGAGVKPFRLPWPF